MKTYQLCTLKVINEENPNNETIEINIEDGLIINKEDGSKKWLIDAIITEEDRALIENLTKEKNELKIEVAITTKNNRPATMDMSIRNIVQLSRNVGILLEGYMKSSK